MVFTALPLVMKAIFEQDINYLTQGLFLRSLFPKLYYVGQKGVIFNYMNYFIWIFMGLCHSLLVFFVPYFVFRVSIINEEGQNGDLWSWSVCSFTAVIFVSVCL